ncbi:hypothetical protein ABZP36_026122 [Zizania latifolia]
MKTCDVLVALCLVSSFVFLPFANAQKWYNSTAAPATQWKISLMTPISTNEEGSTVRIILSDTSSDVRVSFGFYSTDGLAFLLCIFLTHYNGYNDLIIGQPQVIWSANRHRPVSRDATLQFIEEGELLLHDGNGTTLVWSAATKGRSVARMRLQGSGNLVLLDQDGATAWQSFHHPTDSLVFGQSLCRGMNLTANVSLLDWTPGKFYLSTLWNGLQFYFDSIPYTQVFQPTATSNATSTCYEFVNGSLGFPNKVFTLPLARSMQLIRLESDGHLRLYEMKEAAFQMVLDVLMSDAMFCNYPRACGAYGVCSNGQCSCPSLSYFWPLDLRHPNYGCMPVTDLSCNHMEAHQFLALDHISYYSDVAFQALSRSATEEACKQSCLRNCHCKVALFQNIGYDSSGDVGHCLLLSDEQEIMLMESSNNQTSAFVKIQGRLLSDRKRRTKIIVGCVVGCLALSFFVSSVLICKAPKKVEEEEFFVGLTGIPKRFSFKELKTATRNFSVRLGGGGFGSVFQGSIGKETVAVKRLEGVDQGKEEFLAEVETIGRIHHINLVRLVGFCAENSHRLLVYEYMCNGSLDEWIFRRSPVFTLSWNTRRSIIMDIAKGLSYLHEECKQRIAHLDIKPQNILLDAKFNAKLSDFGLSKMISRDESKVMTRLRGTRGYLAPEWLGSKITEKADIYSFGIVIMEIICSRENLDETQPEESIHLISLLQEKARSGLLFDLVDSSSNDMQTHRDEVLEMIKLAMWCLQIDTNSRPLMSTVAKVLEGAMSLENMPDHNFVPNFASTEADVLCSSSSFLPSASHLSGPR